MGNAVSRPVDDFADRCNLARMLYSLCKGDNADDGDERLAMDCGASTSVGVADDVPGMPQSHFVTAEDGADRLAVDCEASTSVRVANELPEIPQSRDVSVQDNGRDFVLEAKHKIFLSHSGAQKSFVADLCADLVRRDRHPFFDKLRDSLPVGHRFPPLIFDAIRQCKVGVVVLSEEFFTRSKWPMLEFVAMVEESRKPNSKIKIIPVFYSISRERCRSLDVQHEWMTKHWRKWEEEDKGRIDVEKWKNALKFFGGTTGLMKKNEMLDGELRAEIVEAVCKMVRPETRWNDSHVEGKTRLFKVIFERIYKGIRPMDLEGGVHVVGLYGMGGVGKSTACKVLCNELSSEYYDKVCHVEIGSARKEELLKEVLRKLSDLEVERLENLNVDMCHDYLKTRLHKDRVFLALDNVSDESDKQAESLLEANFGNGSVVLVTARSMDQLQRLGVKEENCFGMPELEHEEAKSLLLNCAHLKENEVGEEFVKTCLRRCYFSMSSDRKHYHPLALKVLGSEVGYMIRGGKDESAVLSRICDFNLSRRKEHPVFSILRSSFDSVLEEDQLLFLDIALKMGSNDSRRDTQTWTSMEWLCMVHGKDRDEVEDMLECLKRRSLVDSFGEHKDGEWRYEMHDLWREFAKEEMTVGKFREFAKEELKGGKFRDRRWVYEGKKCRGMVDLREYTMLEAVKLRYDGEDVVAVDVRGLKCLKSLEIEISGGVAKEVVGLGTLKGLTYMVLWRAASYECIAEMGLLTNLQHADLMAFLGDRLPDMSMMTSLKALSLRESRFLKCINLQNLPRLSYLDVNRCYAVRSVDISGCSSMKELFSSVGQFVIDPSDGSFRVDSLKGLKELNLSFCPLIPSLEGLKQINKLRKLNITGCSSIEELDVLEVLKNLEELRARYCERLAVLPQCFLPNLRVLDIESSKLPNGVVKEICFPMLDLEHDDAKALFLDRADLNVNDVGGEFVNTCLSRCYVPTGQSSSSDGKQYHRLALQVLGSEVGDMLRGGEDESAVLSRINDVNLSREGEDPVFSILRSSFESMLEEEQLLFLDLALGVAPSPLEVEWLCTVHGKDSDEVADMIERLKRRSLLESFVAYKDGVPVPVNLMLNLWHEFAKEEMKVWKFGDRRWVYEGEECRERFDLREYSKLEVVVLGYNGKNVVAVDVRGLKHLKSLEIKISGGFAKEVVGLGTLESLTYMVLRRAASYECIAELGLLINLQVLDLSFFQGDRLPDMSMMTSLKALSLRDSRFLECINLQNLPSLSELVINGCYAVRSVDISGCRSLTAVTFSTGLLVAREPGGIIGLDYLMKLEELNLSFCPSIIYTAGIGSLRNLRKLNIAGCSSLSKFNGALGCWVKLEELRARDCEGLAMLPECRLPNLRVLDIEPWKVPIGFETFGTLGDAQESSEGSDLIPFSGFNWVSAGGVTDGDKEPSHPSGLALFTISNGTIYLVQ